MRWLGDRIRLLELFALGALVPFAGLMVPAALVAVALGCALPTWAAISLVLLGGLLAGGSWYGLYLGFKSWPRPRGHQLTPAEAPELMDRLQAGGAAWGSPRTGSVVLDPHAWGQDLLGTPTLGLLGWNRFSWVIGIYPLLALSAREWEALVSWEMVWWSAQQGWLNLQIKRLVAYWQLLYTALWEGEPDWVRRVGAGFMRPYTRWIVQKMEGFLVRECLWTDALVAREHGTATLARALCRLAILRGQVDRGFLQELEARLQAGEPMPEDLYRNLSEVLCRCPEHLDGMLELALEGLEPQAPPLLKLRLLNLGAEPAVPMPPAAPAIHQLLGGADILGTFQADLHDLIQNLMHQKALRRQEGDRRFQALGPLVAGWFPHHPHAMEYLNLAFDRTPPEVFGTLLAAACEDQPRHPDCTVLALRCHLREGQAVQAQTLAQAVLARNPFLAPICHRLFFQYYRDQGDRAAADREWLLGRKAEVLQERARKERKSAALTDELEPHGCEAPQLAAMVSYLKAVEGLDQAFLVRKKLAVHQDHPVLLLVVRPQGLGWAWDPKGRKRMAIQARIARECPFPGRATGYVLVMGPGFPWRYRRLLDGLGAVIL